VKLSKRYVRFPQYVLVSQQVPGTGYGYNSDIVKIKCSSFFCNTVCSRFCEIAKTISSQLYLYRAWPNKAEDPELLKLTAKILLDSQTNLKSIQLAFNIVQVYSIAGPENDTFSIFDFCRRLDVDMNLV
jgi:hypothetical protein